MRNFLMIVAGALCVYPAAADELPTSVTYSLGGVMSGPYRLSADLASGVLSEATHPRGKIGDGAGLSTDELQVTGTRTLTPEELKPLRQAAGAVWTNGADIFAAMRKARADMPAEQRRTQDQKFQAAARCMTMDAMGRFDIVKNGVTKNYLFSIPCMNDDAKRLFALLSCGIRPDQMSCKAS